MFPNCFFFLQILAFLSHKTFSKEGVSVGVGGGGMGPHPPHHLELERSSFEVGKGKRTFTSFTVLLEIVQNEDT